MKVGIPREIHTGERRVAATPETIQKLRKLGFEIYVQSKAGEGARFTDDAYRAAGATIIEDASALWSMAISCTADSISLVTSPLLDWLPTFTRPVQ